MDNSPVINNKPKNVTAFHDEYFICEISGFPTAKIDQAVWKWNKKNSEYCSFVANSASHVANFFHK